MRLLRDGAVAHRAGLEALHNGLDRLDLVDRDAERRVAFQLHEAAQRVRHLEIVHQRRVALEGLVAPLGAGLLQQLDREGVVHMVLAVQAGAELVAADGVERRVDAEAERLEGLVVPPLHALADLLHANALDAADRVREIPVDDGAADADALEDLRRLIRLDRGDAHLGGDLHDAREHGLIVVRDGDAGVLVEQVERDELLDALLREIGVDRLRAVAEQGGEMVHRARLRALENEGERRALFGADEIFLHRGHREQGGDRHVVFVHAAVGENEDVRPLLIGPVAGHKEALHRRLQRRALIVEQRDRRHAEALVVHVADLHELHARENRVLDLQHAAVFGPLLEQVAARAEIDRRVRHELFADRVDRRVRHLRKELLEVAEERLPRLREDGERNVRAHGGGRLRAVFRHGDDGLLDLLVGIAEGLVELVAHLLRVGLHLVVRDRQILKVHEILVEPLAVGALRGIVVLELGVVDQALLPGVQKEHPPGTETGLLHHVLRRNVQHADLGGEDQIVVLRAVPTAGAQTVAVEHGAHGVPVGEDDRRRAVPRLHHRRVILIEIALGLRDLFVVRPRLRHGHHHRLRQVDAVHHEKFERVVEHGGVGAALVDHGENAVHVLAGENARVHRLLAGEHPVGVAADRVDLAVVHNQAVRVRALPARVRVRGKAGVHHRHGALAVGVLQVLVKRAQLVN